MNCTVLKDINYNGKKFLKNQSYNLDKKTAERWINHNLAVEDTKEDTKDTKSNKKEADKIE